MTPALSELVEAIAWWRVGLPDGRRILESAAVDLLVSGDERPTVAELAGLYPDSNAFAIDSLIDRLVDELDLRDALSTDPDTIATRRVCRSVLAGESSEYQLTLWVHRQFYYWSDSELLVELATIYDQYDETEVWNTSVEMLDKRVREIAMSILQAESNETG